MTQEGRNTYIVDGENAGEIARLIIQDRLLTGVGVAMGDDLFKRAQIRSVLDIGCGPGAWLLELAQRFPGLESLVGIDVSSSMLNYASSQAEASKLRQVTFRRMDATYPPLDFVDGTFDLVNARLITGFMHKDGWATLIADCFRLLRSGGILQLTEFEDVICSSLAFETLNMYYIQALHQSGRGFLTSQVRHLSTAPFLRKLLQDAGFLDLQLTGKVVDFSSGTPYHQLGCENIEVAYALMQPFFLSQGLSSSDELQRLLQQFQRDRSSPDFSGVALFLGASGKKP